MPFNGQNIGQLAEELCENSSDWETIYKSNAERVKLQEDLVGLLDSNDKSVQRNAISAIINISNSNQLGKELFIGGSSNHALQVHLVNFLNSSDYSLQQYALGAIWCFTDLDSGKRLFVTGTMRNELQEQLVSLLNSQDEGVQKFTVWIIGNLVDRNQAGQELFINGSNCHQLQSGLVKLLSSRNENIQYSTAIAISNISILEAGKKLLISGSSRRELQIGLVNLLSSTNEDIQKYALEAIMNIIYLESGLELFITGSKHDELQASLVNLLNATNEDVKENASLVIYLMASSELGCSSIVNSSRRHEIQAGLVKLLSSRNEDVQEQAAKAIVNLACLDLGKELFIKGNYNSQTQSSLVGLLSSSDEYVQQSAVLVIANIVCSNSGRELFINGSHHDQLQSGLVGLLSSRNADVQKRAAWAIGNVACLDSGRELFINGSHHDQLQSGLVELLSSNNEIVQHYAAATIANITCVVSGRELFANGSHNDHLQSGLVELLSSSNEDVQEQAARVIANLACLDLGKKLFINGSHNDHLQSGLVELLSSSNEDAQKQAVRAIGNIARLNSGRELFINGSHYNNLRLGLVGLLSSSDEYVQRCAAWMIANIARHNQLGKELFNSGDKKEELRDGLLSLLSSSNEDVQKRSLSAIISLTDDNQAGPVLFSSGVQKDKIKQSLLSLLDSPNKDIQSNAAIAIENITISNEAGQLFFGNSFDKSEILNKFLAVMKDTSRKEWGRDSIAIALANIIANDVIYNAALREKILNDNPEIIDNLLNRLKTASYMKTARDRTNLFQLVDKLDFRDRVLEVNLFLSYIDEFDFEEVLKLLRGYPSLQGIVLYYNDIGEDYITALADSLISNVTLQWAEVYNNKLDNKGAEEIARIISGNQVIREFIFIGNEIDDKGKKVITNAILGSDSLFYVKGHEIEDDERVKGKLAENLSNAEQLADQGNVELQWRLASFYADQNIGKDKGKAKLYLTKAADNGHLLALRSALKLYGEGKSRIINWEIDSVKNFALASKYTKMLGGIEQESNQTGVKTFVAQFQGGKDSPSIKKLPVKTANVQKAETQFEAPKSDIKKQWTKSGLNQPAKDSELKEKLARRLLMQSDTGSKTSIKIEKSSVEKEVETEEPNQTGVKAFISKFQGGKDSPSVKPVFKVANVQKTETKQEEPKLADKKQETKTVTNQPAKDAELKEKLARRLSMQLDTGSKTSIKIEKSSVEKEVKTEEPNQKGVKAFISKFQGGSNSPSVKSAFKAENVQKKETKQEEQKLADKKQEIKTVTNQPAKDAELKEKLAKRLSMQLDTGSKISTRIEKKSAEQEVKIEEPKIDSKKAEENKETAVKAFISKFQGGKDSLSVKPEFKVANLQKTEIKKEEPKLADKKQEIKTVTNQPAKDAELKEKLAKRLSMQLDTGSKTSIKIEKISTGKEVKTEEPNQTGVKAFISKFQGGSNSPSVKPAFKVANVQKTETKQEEPKLADKKQEIETVTNHQAKEAELKEELASRLSMQLGARSKTSTRIEKSSAEQVVKIEEPKLGDKKQETKKVTNTPANTRIEKISAEKEVKTEESKIDIKKPEENKEKGVKAFISKFQGGINSPSVKPAFKVANVQKAETKPEEPKIDVTKQEEIKKIDNKILDVENKAAEEKLEIEEEYQAKVIELESVSSPSQEQIDQLHRLREETSNKLQALESKQKAELLKIADELEEVKNSSQKEAQEMSKRYAKIQQDMQGKESLLNKQERDAKVRMEMQQKQNVEMQKMLTTLQERIDLLEGRQSKYEGSFEKVGKIDIEALGARVEGISAELKLEVEEKNQLQKFLSEFYDRYEALETIEVEDITKKLQECEEKINEKALDKSEIEILKNQAEKIRKIQNDLKIINNNAELQEYYSTLKRNLTNGVTALRAFASGMSNSSINLGLGSYAGNKLLTGVKELGGNIPGLKLITDIVSYSAKAALRISQQKSVEKVTNILSSEAVIEGIARGITRRKENKISKKEVILASLEEAGLLTIFESVTEIIESIEQGDKQSLESISYDKEYSERIKELSKEIGIKELSLLEKKVNIDLIKGKKEYKKLVDIISNISEGKITALPKEVRSKIEALGQNKETQNYFNGTIEKIMGRESARQFAIIQGKTIIRKALKGEFKDISILEDENIIEAIVNLLVPEEKGIEKANVKAEEKQETKSSIEQKVVIQSRPQSLTQREQQKPLSLFDQIAARGKKGNEIVIEAVGSSTAKTYGDVIVTESKKDGSRVITEEQRERIRSLRLGIGKAAAEMQNSKRVIVDLVEQADKMLETKYAQTKVKHQVYFSNIIKLEMISIFGKCRISKEVKDIKNISIYGRKLESIFTAEEIDAIHQYFHSKYVQPQGKVDNIYIDRELGDIAKKLATLYQAQLRELDVKELQALSKVMIFNMLECIVNGNQVAEDLSEMVELGENAILENQFLKLAELPKEYNKAIEIVDTCGIKLEDGSIYLRGGNREVGSYGIRNATSLEWNVLKLQRVKLNYVRKEVGLALVESDEEEEVMPQAESDSFRSNLEQEIEKLKKQEVQRQKQMQEMQNMLMILTGGKVPTSASLNDNRQNSEVNRFTQLEEERLKARSDNKYEKM